MLDLSIVIVNWNTRELLRTCLQSLPTSVGDLTYEVLVVDNASSDGSARMVAREFPDYELLPGGGNLGFSRGNNLALPRTAGRAVLLLNPDTVCPPGALRTLYAFMESKTDLGAVGPRLIDGDGRPTLTWGFFPRAGHHWLGFVDPRRQWLRGRFSRRRTVVPEPDEPSARVEYVTGACFLIPRAALDRVGLLDERFFMYFEETDWCLRARQAGLDVWYCAETEVMHLEGQAAGTVSDFSLRQFQKSYRLFIEKHYGGGRLWQFRLAQFCECGLKALLRRVAPGNREANRAASRTFAAKAKLQLQGKIEVRPPA